MSPALVPWYAWHRAGHAAFVGELSTEGLRRLRCAIAAGPALRELRADEAEQRQLDDATRADELQGEIDADAQERAAEDAADRRREERRERWDSRST